MLLFRLTTKTYLSPQLLEYLPIDVPIHNLHGHFHTVFLITIKIYPSTFLLFCMSTDVPVHHYTCSVYFLFFGITCTMSFQLVYWGTYTHIHPKRNVPVYPHAFLWSNKKYLPVSTTTSVPAHRCTRSWPYLFISILSFRLTVKNYPSTVPLFYMSTDVPVHQYTCSIYFLFFCVSYATTFEVIYWSTYPRSTRKYIYLFTFMLLFHLTIKTYLSPQLLVYLPIFVPIHGPVYFDTFIPINCLDLPVNISTVLHVHSCTCSSLYCSACPQMYLFITIPVQFISSFSA